MVDWLIEYLDIITSVIGTFSVIAAATPNKVDNSVAKFLTRAIHLIALNVGHARPKELQ